MAISRDQPAAKYYEGWDTDSHRREFDRWNAQSDAHFRFAYGCFAEVRYLASVVQTFERPSILDVGCATGTTYRYLSLVAGRPFDYVGVDLSAAAIDRAKELHPRADFREKGLERLLEFTGRKYDIVFSRDTVLHQVDPYEFLAQLLEVTGRFLVLRLRTRDVGDTVFDIEQSCQMHYDRYWMPYIVLNIDELIGRLKGPSVARITVNRSYEVLGGQNYRYLPKELYFARTGGAETSLLIEIVRAGTHSATEIVHERVLEGQAFLRLNRMRRYQYAAWSALLRRLTRSRFR